MWRPINRETQATAPEPAFDLNSERSMLKHHTKTHKTPCPHKPTPTSWGVVGTFERGQDGVGPLLYKGKGRGEGRGVD
jgi:hypothetical protein